MTGGAREFFFANDVALLNKLPYCNIFKYTELKIHLTLISIFNSNIKILINILKLKLIEKIAIFFHERTINLDSMDGGYPPRHWIGNNNKFFNIFTPNISIIY
jgi:hypothetical protein